MILKNTYPKFKNISLLLIEDNLIIQKIVVAILKKWNIDVDIANNGLEGFEKNKSNHYHIILMDTHMPVMDGIEAIKKIRNEPKGINSTVPIISLSGSLTETEKSQVFEAGADNLIEKPFEIGNLHHKINDLIYNKVYGKKDI